MKIYISGILGPGMGPLALMAKDAGISVCGSDEERGVIYDELVEAGIEVYVGEQDGKFLQEKLAEGVDWFVYTSALPVGHKELMLALESDIKVTKRDELTEFLVQKLGLKMVAVAGTHGKTTTTAMIVWAALKLGLPVAYLVGTTLGFAPSGSYKKGDKFFVYEADEYDRNFLKFHPWLSVLVSVTYDHPDIYKTREEYVEAFEQFKSQSEHVFETQVDADKFDKVVGAARREDAGFATEALMKMEPSLSREKVIEIINEFPGVGRRFERLEDGVYSDYAHNPEEVAATMEIAQEEIKLRGKKGVVALYQPHQNERQYEFKDDYKDVFLKADKILWLPTCLVREKAGLPILSREELTAGITNKDDIIMVEMNDELVKLIRKFQKEGYIVVLMSVGTAGLWLREHFGKQKNQ